MYIRKSVGWRMEPSGRPTLTGYSYEDFPSRNTRSQLLLRKDKIRPNSWPEIPKVTSLWKRPVFQILSKGTKRSAVEQEDLKRNYKEGSIPEGDNKPKHFQRF